MRSGRRIHPLAAALAVVASLSSCGLHGKPAVERKAAPPPGSTASSSGARVEAVDPARVIAPGIVESWGGDIQLSAKESGWIDRVLVREGERVEAGRLLVLLDDAPQRRAVDLAQAEVAEAEAALARIEAGSTAEELRRAGADRDAAAVRAELARADAARSARLVDGGAVAVADAERNRAEARALTALAAGAQARLEELERGARAEDRRAATARAAAARARLRLAEAALASRRVEAPAPGTILVSRAHAGEFYAAGAGPLLVLGDTSRIQVRLEVDEIDAPAVAGGAGAALYSDGGVLLAEGAVFRVAPRMGRKGLPIESPTSRQDVRVREVFVEVPASSGLVPGQRVWGHVARPERTDGSVAYAPSGPVTPRAPGTVRR
jgi:multidrug resistance efflux pump